MDEQARRRLLEKNEKLIQMVIERAKRDFPEDIALIGLSGSFSTGDFHEKSDLDLVIVNNTNRGWEISRCFILDDVGYDIYCTPWDTRIEAEARLESPMVSCLADLKILYCAKPEYLERFNACRQRALDILAKPLGAEALERAEKSIERAKRYYADLFLLENTGRLRYAAGQMLEELVNALTHMNNTYIKRGVKRYLEELNGYRNLPDGFSQIYMAVIQAKTPEEIRASSQKLLTSVVRLRGRLAAELVPPPIPTKENLPGSYEELWCNYRNKILASTNANDPHYAYWTAVGAQNYLDEMHSMLGLPEFDLMKHFDAENLTILQKEFQRILDVYQEEYDHLGLKVDRYDTFEQLYESYMGKPFQKTGE